MSLFSPDSGIDDRPKNGELLPDKLLAKGVIVIRGIKKSGSTGGEYADAEITLTEGQFAKRKVWPTIMSPVDPLNSAESRKMGMIAMTRMFEAAGIFKVGDDPSYARFGDKPTFQQLADAINGQEVAFKVGIEKAKPGSGYNDKNRVVEWLSPSPKAEGGHKGWQMLHDPAYVAPTASPAASAPTTGGLAAGNYASPQSVGVGATASGPSWVDKAGAAAEAPATTVAAEADQGDSAATAAPVGAGPF